MSEEKAAPKFLGYPIRFVERIEHAPVLTNDANGNLTLKEVDDVGRKSPAEEGSEEVDSQ